MDRRRNFGFGIAGLGAELGGLAMGLLDLDHGCSLKAASGGLPKCSGHLKSKSSEYPFQLRATDPMGQYIQYGVDGGMVRKNAPGAIWMHGKC